MRVLFIATVRSHIGQFHMPLIRALKAKGWIVDAAFRDNSKDKPGLDLSIIDNTFEIPFERNPFSSSNINAYKILKKVIDNNHYDVIHCNTPVGAVVGRLAAKSARRKGTAVFYTAHGFHFFKGAPLKNWLLFYPIEKYLSRYTDLLITINQYDYDLAIKKKFKAKKIVKIDGVGVDYSKFHIASEEEKSSLRWKYSYNQNAFILLYAADLSYRKNQQMIFRALGLIKDQIKNTLLLLPGQPILKEEYEAQCKELGISDMVQFLGYRRDIDMLLAMCDCVVSSAKQEGLPLNLIEAAATGKYIIATDVRGNSDVVSQSGYGVTVALNDYIMMADHILEAYQKAPLKSSVQAAENVLIYEQNRIVERIMEFYFSATDLS